MSMLPADAHRRLDPPAKIDVDGWMVKHPWRPHGLLIPLIGTATHVGMGRYRCLANVDGALCLVEILIRQ